MNSSLRHIRATSAMIALCSSALLIANCNRNADSGSDPNRFVSKHIAILNSDDGVYQRSELSRVIKSDMRFGEKNIRNRGAEALHVVLKSAPNVSDTDNDGLLEVADVTGTPLVLLLPDMTSDVVINLAGYHQAVDYPPYCTTGVYLSRLMCHAWSRGDAR